MRKKTVIKNIELYFFLITLKDYSHP